ncbi:MAG: hypothetical protein Q8R12_04770 [bacterium]|nr:hypothetical protein [bacterium]
MRRPRPYGGKEVKMVKFRCDKCGRFVAAADVEAAGRPGQILCPPHEAAEYRRETAARVERLKKMLATREPAGGAVLCFPPDGG